MKIDLLDSPKFVSVPRLFWQAALKKTEESFLIDIAKLLVVEKGIRGGICNSINRYAKTNRKYIKGYDKNKELPDLKILACK